MRRPILAALALSASALATLAFAQTAPAPTDEEVAAALKTYNAETVVGTASGVDVTLGDLALALASLPPQVRGAPMEQIAPALRRQVMDETILAKMAKDAGLENDPRAARRLAAITRSFLAETYLVQEIEKQVTDEALKAAYAEATKDFKPEAKVHARHILVKTEDEAKALVEELKGGKDFAELAAEKSTGPSGPRGGDLGWFTIDQMVGPFAEAAFALETPGDVSAPVETQFGWHVIKLEEKGETEAPVFEEMKEELRAKLSEEAARTVIEAARAAAETKDAETQPPAWLITRPEILGE